MNHAIAQALTRSQLVLSLYFIILKAFGFGFGWFYFGNIVSEYISGSTNARTRAAFLALTSGLPCASTIAESPSRASITI
jgi:hypothetical protein